MCWQSLELSVFRGQAIENNTFGWRGLGFRLGDAGPSYASPQIAAQGQMSHDEQPRLWISETS
jgi:hypothetical protein